MISLSDNQKIGVGLTTLGVVFLSLGVLFFFDAGLLIIGFFFLSSIFFQIIIFVYYKETFSFLQGWF